MQYNQPFFKTARNEYGQFNAPKSVPYSKVIGEGDVTSVIFPDGTVQLYFVPAVWSPYQSSFQPKGIPCYEGNVHMEPWFVRSITYPIPTVNNNQILPGTNDPFSPQLYNPNCCVDVPTFPQYNQKFHNDNSTSTTDIYYFFPSSVKDRILKYSAIVQTEQFCECHKILEEKDASYNCKGRKKSLSNVSDMSVDDEYHSKHLSKSKKCARCSKQTKKIRKIHDNICKCNKNTSDKYVTTFAEQGSGCMVKDGRQTQTVRQKSKRKNNKTKRHGYSDCCSSSNSTCSGMCVCASDDESD